MPKKLFLILILAALLAGCNLPNRVNEPDVEPGALTLAVQTVGAQLTLDAITTGVPTNTLSPGQPTITLAPTSTPEPTDTPEVICDAAGFVRDVTIEDGEEMYPGEAFTKTWRLSNLGDCEWNEDYDLVFDEGASMDGPASVPVTKGIVDPGDQVDVSVDLVAPAEDGIYKGTWQMRNDQNEVFTSGGFWVEIEVVEVGIYSSKSSFQVGQTAQADLEDGTSPPGDTADFVFTVASANDKRITPVNGATFLLMGEDQPEVGTCLQAELEEDFIQVDSDIVGQFVCYETDEGRLGRFEVTALNPNDITQIQTLTLRYVTWVEIDDD